MDTNTTEDNWGYAVIKESLPSLPPGNITDFSMTIHEPIIQPAHSPTHTTKMGHAFLNDPLEGHWGYPIIEESPPLTPLQEVDQVPKEAPNPTVLHFSEEHLNFLMDIH